jgi:hypothetical protein
MTPEDIQLATVRFPRLGGYGVLVGKYVLTAAHCIELPANGVLDLCDHIELVEVAGGGKLQLSVVALEFVTDIAALTAPDDQRLPEQAEAFWEFAETPGVPLFQGGVAQRRGAGPVPVRRRPLVRGDGRDLRARPLDLSGRLAGSGEGDRRGHVRRPGRYR